MVDGRTDLPSKYVGNLGEDDTVCEPKMPQVIELENRKFVSKSPVDVPMSIVYVISL